MDENTTAADAARDLFQLYGDDVYKYARFMLGSVTEAEDATQEVFTRVFQSWERFEKHSQAKTWIWSIARNYLYDVLRKRKRSSELFDANSSVDGVPAQSLDSKFFDVEIAINSLRPSYRQVVILRYMQDVSITETAQMLGWTEGKVRVQAHRALRELRIILDADSKSKYSMEGDRFGV